MNPPEPPFRAWVVKAESDLLNITNNLAAANVPWDTVCFHAQQAAEKLLKAFLAWKERDLLRTHDLVALLAQCVTLDPSLAELENDCRKLTYYAVGSRYPDMLYEPDEEDGREMVSAMHRVRSAILARLPHEGSHGPGQPVSR
jgi:HEPN domain-containing protein